MARIPKTERDEVLSATRQQLLDAAVVEFARNGFTRANINHISEAAGYSKGTIYNYFPSKQALMLALIGESSAKHFQYIADQVRQASDPAQRLARFYEAGFRFIEENPAHARFLITTLFSSGADLQAAMYFSYQPMFQFVAQEIVAPGVEQGVFRAVNPVDTATLLMTLYLGTGSNTDKDGKVYLDPRQVAEFALSALRRGDGASTVGGKQ
ncbi:MAG: TetR/AcrR family transcriptional regulator [Chloroflexi bacterium]|nr:MAG: TetR/AcrR family transcriptional regulator [Chloroflexota bacterium]